MTQKESQDDFLSEGCLLEQQLFLWPETPRVPFEDIWRHVEKCPKCTAELENYWAWYRDGYLSGSIAPSTLPNGIADKETLVRTWLLCNRGKYELIEYIFTNLEERLRNPVVQEEIRSLLRAIVRGVEHHTLKSPVLIKAYEALLVAKHFRKLEELLGRDAFAAFFDHTADSKYTGDEIGRLWIAEKDISPEVLKEAQRIIEQETRDLP